MPTVAEHLRRAREAQNLDIYQVAEITKIKTDHIRALESGNYDGFAAPIYIRGFVRTYARILKLDTGEVGAILDEELSETEKFRDPPPLTDDPRGFVDFLMLQLSKLNWGFVVVAAAVGLLVLLGLAGWDRWRNRETLDPVNNLEPGLYEGGGSGGTLKIPDGPGQ